MKELEFSIEINASKARVWDTLWQDESFRDWAGIIDPGTYMVGALQEGNLVQFISAENGYGVTSLVEKLVVGELLLLRHSALPRTLLRQYRLQIFTNLGYYRRFAKYSY